MKIPEEKIQEVREATDLLEVIGQYVTLRKRGRTYLGLCPFHTEKTPSFNVDPVRGFYHCFGCGAGGNVFTFLMQMERIAFPEAVRQLAKKAGIALPEQDEDDAQARETELLYHVNDFAAQFFVRNLFETAEGQKALAYFQKRGFTEEDAKTFGLGYAPSGWEGLIQAARKASVSSDALLKAGLAIASQKNRGAYDRFRGRLMFPIHNASGRVLGFGGRLLAKTSDQPKYVNSSETAIYQKSRLVYGLFQAKNAIRDADRILLVEGYTDVIRLRQAGLAHAVASSGTALTPGQVALLSRYAKRVTLVYDGDEAGLEAAQRGSEILLAGGMEVGVVALPAGADPDSFLREQGREALDLLLKEPKTFIDFRLDRLRQADRLKTPADRASAARELLGTVKKIPDAIFRNLSMKAVAQRLDVDLSVLAQAVGRAAPNHPQPSAPAFKPPPVDKARQRAEKALIRLLLDNGSRWADAVFHLVTPALFTEGVHRTVAELIHEGYLKGRVPGLQDLLARFPEDEAVGSYLARVMAEGLAEDIDLSRLGLECATHLRQAELHAEVQAVRERMRGAGEAEMLALQKTYAQLKTQALALPTELQAAWKTLVEG